MSAILSEAGGVTYDAHADSTHLDSDDFAALNINSGTGTQTNYHQTGTHNTQFNAHTQTFYNTTQPLTEQEKITVCLNALIAVRPEDQRAALISAKGDRVGGTCEWIKDDEAYRSLLQGNTRLLWIQGGPGKGKTMLSIYLTQDLEVMHQVIFFFCQADDEMRRNATHVLRSLIWQLAVRRPPCACHLPLYLYPPHEKQAVLDSRESLWSLFKKISNDFGSSVFCLLDGLDECDDDSQRWLAAKFMSIYAMNGPEASMSAVRTIIVSRPKALGLRADKCILLGPDNSDRIGRDIATFVRTKVEDLSSQLEDLSDELRSEFKSQMQAELINRAESTFLWVGFATAELLQQETRTQMEAVMRQLPRGLPALYDRMLLQIDPSHWPISSKILRWVAMAVRPLHVNDLKEIVGSERSGPMSSDLRIIDQIRICGSLITVSNAEERSAHEPGTNDFRTVSLVHESVREYFILAQTRYAAALECFFFEPSVVHLEMATTCLAYIERRKRDYTTHDRSHRNLLDESFARENSPRCPSFDSEARGFSNYAALHWPEHARFSGDNFKQLVAAAPMFFKRRSCLRDGWWTNVSRASGLRPLIDRGFAKHDIPALHMACFLGIASWVTELLRPRLGFLPRLRQHRSHGEYGFRPLMYASMGGHSVIVNQLLRSCARIDSKDRSRKTALHHAVRYEQVEVTQLLLNRGANADAKDQEGYSALHVAAEIGNVELMQQVLEHPVTLESRCNGCQYESKDGCTPLHLAAGYGHADVIECLLRKGADIESKDAAQQTPLHVAAYRGRVAESLLLLKKRANANVRSDLGTTPLHSAAASPRPSYMLLRFLLAFQADVSARSCIGETPLHFAASNRHASEATLRVLLDGGADVNARTTSGMRPLHAAAKTRGLDIGILEKLIQEGAEVDSLSDDGHSPLDLALKIEPRSSFMQPDLRNARILIEYGATVSTTDNTTLLHKAASIGDEPLVKVLLDHGFRPMISAPDSAGVTPLHRAIIGSDTMLDIEGDGSFASTELLVFEQHHPASIVRILLENGADVEVADQHGDTPLHYATKCGRKEIVLMLLKFEADVTVKARNGKTALQMARATGNDDLVQILVEHGAQDVD